MFEFITDADEERGQVGIGTLIVFIAMVLVAAIAAGVLINTAGFLQEQSEATGEESTQQVTDRIQVFNSVGDHDGSNVNTAKISITKSPGANDINLSETTIDLVGSNGGTTLGYSDSGADGSNFTTTEITGSGDNILSDEQQYQIVLDLQNIEAVNDASTGLSTGNTVELRVTTPSGAVTAVELRAPESLSGNAVEL
ncbi:archaellin/type IV pilin N-terminal domain-containing protein [Halopenitus sp. POP-27]|uniref:archaellin/type IV pilin N-terminal domain-containing protein n=1 Tax=Halopenitus sp. POP-27 TaxID=2994425 RepID=UPI002468E1C8|nr:archaellin/type IV pilin N-terminal domain-containing protein [Halopenitus sp. POP-27]